MVIPLIVAIVSMWFILNDIDKKNKGVEHGDEGCGDACVSTQY